MSLTPQDLHRNGTQHARNREFKEAIEYFTLALQKDGDRYDIKYDRAKAYSKAGMLDKALNDFNDLINHDPHNAHFFSERAIVYLLLKDQVNSIRDLDKAVELEPMKAFRYASRAFIRERFGDLQGALKDYERAIELDPEDAISYNNKGLVEEKLGYQKKAQQSFSLADALDPLKKNNLIQTDPVKPEPPSVDETDKNESSQLSLTNYLRQVSAIMRSPEERKSFGKFLKDFFSRNA